MNKKTLAISLILLFIPLSVFADRLTNLRDVDLISVSAYMNDGIARISITYKNRDKDQLVFWEEGAVRCEYAIYKNVDNILNPKQGEKIASGVKKLTRSGQDFYVDIPSRYTGPDKLGIVECTVHTGSKPLHASDAILFY